MHVKRKPFQGLMNVLRFNWHFYIAAVAMIIISQVAVDYFDNPWQWALYGLLILVIITTFISLLITFVVYDLSGLYDFIWLDEYNYDHPMKILNINAGFDETSLILATKFGKSVLHICDFYDPEHHTEISIRRARKAYPPHPETIKVKTNSLPFGDWEFEMVCLTFAAHEIRNSDERKTFFKELKRVTKSDGKIFVTEHLRDLNNFAAYTLGFFHFFPKGNWLETFNSSGLTLVKEHKTTPFVTTFILQHHGMAN